MEQISEFRTLDFARTIKDSFVLGFRNAASIFGCVILWLLTIWVPYINIGTTIALAMLPLEVAKGKIVSPLSIFHARYRRYMGEFLITSGLKSLAIVLLLYVIACTTIVTVSAISGASFAQVIQNPESIFSYAWIVVALIVFIIAIFAPVFVLYYAWSLAYYFLFDRNMNPVQSIKASNDATYGSKWTIFFVRLLMGILIYAIGLVVMGIFMAIGVWGLTIAVTVVLLAFLFSFIVGMDASIWKQLSDNVA